jgi:elongation factor P
MLQFPQIKLGSIINYNDAPCVVVKCDFMKVNRGKPVKQCTMKNLITGSNFNYSFKSGESIEEADMAKKQATFLYEADGNLSFMVTETYETIELNKEIMSDKANYLKEGLEVYIVFYNDNPISVDLPIKIGYKIIETSPAVKGNSVNNITKEATIETGRVIRVPAFIESGEKVLVNTIEDEYVERDNS